MALQKPTITNCVDGKEHTWLIVTEENDEQGTRFEHRWCQKCGALTQVVYDENQAPVAVLGPDNNPYLMVPKIMAAVAK
ncbi:MAG: hypothetical protein AB1896_17730 [Thermodesulfobacteriota bacterium]